MDIQALDWTHRFQRYLETERRVSPHTASAYRRNLAALVTFCEQERIETWAALSVKAVRMFAARSHAAGLGATSIQQRLSAIRTFQNFLIRERVINYNTARDVSAPKAGRPLPRLLTVDEMTQLIERPKPVDRYFVCDLAIMELFYSSGLRLAELVGLNLGDLALAEGLVRVLGKGSRERIVPVGRRAITALPRYLAERKRKATPGESALFLGRNGRRLTGRTVEIRVALWARNAGISQHVHPHMFRHSCATHVLESSGSIRGVQELLGHASISTTAIYTHLNFQYLAEAYESAHPRARRAKDPSHD